jgi:hypothetical protein
MLLNKKVVSLGKDHKDIFVIFYKGVIYFNSDYSASKNVVVIFPPESQ